MNNPLKPDLLKRNTTVRCMNPDCGKQFEHSHLWGGIYCSAECLAATNDRNDERHNKEAARPSKRKYTRAEEYWGKIECQERQPYRPTLTCPVCSRPLQDALQSVCYKCGWRRVEEATG